MTLLGLQLGTPYRPSLGGLGPPVATIILTGNTIAENAALGAAVGTLSVINATGTPAFTLVDSAGSRFALSGANVQRGATALDYEAAISHNIIVSVTGMTPSPANATLTINVTDIVESSYQAESEVIFAAMTGLTDPRKTVIDNLVASLKSAGVWTKTDFLHVYAAHNSGASLVNWKNPGTFNATAVNSPTFTVDRGYAGDGSSSYLNTGFNAVAAAGNSTLNSTHLGVWNRAAWTGTQIGAYANPQGTVIQNTGDTALTSYANSNTGMVSTVVAGSKHIVITRGNSTNYDAFSNGGNKETETDTSTGISASPVFVCCMSYGSAPSEAPLFHTTTQISMAHQGGDLSDAEVASCYTALAAYMTAVGA